MCRINNWSRNRSTQRPGIGKKSTGLGLNLVKEITELHKGEIKLENRETGGVYATLALPVTLPV